MSDSEEILHFVSWYNRITVSTVCPVEFSDLLDGQKVTKHLKKPKKPDRQSCQTWDFGRKCVCACVCWQEHTTTAACHFGLSTNGHLFWIKWSSPLPSALLCIYHVVYSKVIFNMRAPFPMCCSTTNHRASDECDNAQSCGVFSPHLSLVISSEIRWDVDILTALSFHSVCQRWRNRGDISQMFRRNILTFPSTVSHDKLIISVFYVSFP